jgi:hypothetical protein
MILSSSASLAQTDGRKERWFRLIDRTPLGTGSVVSGLDPSDHAARASPKQASRRAGGQHTGYILSGASVDVIDARKAPSGTSRTRSNSPYRSPRGCTQQDAAEPTEGGLGDI